MKYGEINLGQIEAIVNKLGGIEGVKRFLSGELVIKEAETKLNVFRVTVDYAKFLKEMIQAGKYDWTNNDITSDHFPIQGEGRKEVEITLFHFNRVISSDDAITEMEKQGFRSARIEELLVLGAAYPELQKQFPIATFGSVWQAPDGDRSVPCLHWHGAERATCTSTGLRVAGLPTGGLLLSASKSLEPLVPWKKALTGLNSVRVSFFD